MRVERAGRWEIVGIVAGAVIIASLLLLPWFTLSDVPTRDEQRAWICGTGELTCVGFDTFPILRWLLIAGALAPLILTYILLRKHKLSWAPGEMTMIVGFTATVLIAYNGLIQRPAPESGFEYGTTIEYGYYIALGGAIAISVSGYLRSLDSGGRQGRKAPGTV
ncbi:MAG: hypothetical protein H0W09_08390 [Solirubrobacterales bacterium]|nr:hypothetical protein [Solirubrobacterales bacterium]